MSDAPSAPSSAPAPSGPASASDAQLTGRFADERNAGYREMPQRAAPKQPQRTEREFSDGKEAAAELVKKRKHANHTAPEARPVRYTDEKGRAAPKNETVTLERAADDLKHSRQSDAIGKEINERDDLARQVDQLRADAGVPTQIDPEHADPNQVDPKVFGDLPAQAPQIDPAHLPQDLQPTPGVDAELARAMQHPQVRKELEEQFGRATQLQQHHAQQVQVANDFAQAAFRSAFPEMANLQPNQIVPLLNQMAKTNPARFQQAKTMLENVGKADIARKQIEAQRQHAEKQEFQRYSKEQDSAFEKAIGQRTPQQRQEIATEMVAMAADYGINRDTLIHLMQSNPIMRHAGMQRVFHEAAAGRLARKQLATLQQQQRAANLPPVQRPGTSSAGGVRQVQNANLQQLSARLTQSGDAKDAAKLLSALRAQRGR